MDYRVIIVDDEKNVREGLTKHFTWEKYSIEVAGCFEDGKNAWEFLLGHEVDIIITDVRMARMDGVTLAKKAMEKYPEISILFISGYADVEYLRDALKVDAIDYILKSIDLDELASAIEKTVHRIREKRAEKEKFQDMSHKLELSLPLLRRQILLGVLRENDEDLLQELYSLELPLVFDTWYCVIVLRIAPESKWKLIREMSEKERILTGMQIEELCKNMLEEYGKCVICNDRCIEYFLIVNIRQDSYEEELFGISQKLQQQITEQFHMDTVIGISEAFKAATNLHEAYLGACKAIESGYLIEEAVPVSINKYSLSKAELLHKEAEQKLRGALLSGNRESVCSMLCNVLQMTDKIQSEEEKTNFLLFLLQLPPKMDMRIKGIGSGNYFSLEKLLWEFLTCETLEEREKMLLNLYEKFADRVKETRQPHDHTAILKVQNTISEKYMEQISIISLADMVNLTPAYLCVLFRQKYGMTINEYMTQIRMEKAKELLGETQLHLYEICYQVGYLSPAYFSRLFKKYTGQTPKEWRDTHG